MSAGPRRRWLVPEVIQTSAMDCGPAALKCLLEGFGVAASARRLRDICQTSIDGTSIDVLEEVAGDLGLAAEQMVLPSDHVLLPESRALPALAVMRSAEGATHFVVLWRRHGDFVQVMDPASGRQWVRTRDLLGELYVHTMHVPADELRAVATGDLFLGAMRRRMRELRVASRAAEELVASALSDPSYIAIAALDASVRMLAAVVEAGGIRSGAEATRSLRALFDAARTDPRVVPEGFWTALPDEERRGGVVLRGAVLLQIDGMTEAAASRPRAGHVQREELAAPSGPDEEAPLRVLARMLRADGLTTPLVLALAIALATAGALVQAVLLRAMLDTSRFLVPGLERSSAVLALAAFVGLLALLELPLASGLARLGRHLEVRIAAAYFAKLPRLAERYFATRLPSDLAERGHALHLIRHLPEIGASLLRATFALIATTAGIAWVSPSSAPLAALMAVLAVALPLAAHPLLSERDFRFRAYQGALARFYLDAFLGLVPIRAHDAGRTLRREHEGLLVDWVRAGYRIRHATLGLDAILALTSLAQAAWLVHHHMGRGLATGSLLLLVYWTLQLPMLGEELALGLRRYPALRSVTLRILELLAAPEEGERASATPVRASGAARSGGCAIVVEGASVRAGGRELLRDVHLHLGAGEHVAIVGSSGAGKSTLVGLLMGWLTPSQGRVEVDGELLCGRKLAELRAETAWLDPSVHIWNRTLLENIIYGAADGAAETVGELCAASALEDVLARMPEGLQAPLGEGGTLVSGGEGQRVRLARALTRPDARLAVLDEPFRGLARDQRSGLMARARATWRHATLVCVTHDVSETLAFDRVLVIEDGQLVEEGPPAALARRAGSRYRALVDDERQTRADLWERASFRSLELVDGVLRDAAGAAS